MNSKEIKNKARQSLKKHYLVFMIVCLVAGLLGVSYSSSLSILNSEKGAEESVSETAPLRQLLNTLSWAP